MSRGTPGVLGIASCRLEFPGLFPWEPSSGLAGPALWSEAACPAGKRGAWRRQAVPSRGVLSSPRGSRAKIRSSSCVQVWNPPSPLPPARILELFLFFPSPTPVLPWARDELLCLWRCQGSVPPECPQRQWAWGQRQMGALNLPSLPSTSEVLAQPGPKRLLLRPPGTINVSVPFQHPGGPPPAPTGAPLAHHLGGNLYSSPSIAAQTQVETLDLI